MQQPRYRGQHVLRYFLLWLLGWTWWSERAIPRNFLLATGPWWPAGICEWACAEGGRPCAGPAAPPLCITLYYGYRVIEGWPWKQPDGTACSWRRVREGAHRVAGLRSPGKFAVTRALLLSLLKRSSTVSRELRVLNALGLDLLPPQFQQC